MNENEIIDLIWALVSVKDARIRELEKDNAILKSQIDQLELTYWPVKEH